MNYDKYTFRRREMISFLIAVTVLFLLIGKLFFGTFLAGGLCIVFFPFLWKKKKKQLLEKRKKQLVKEFKDLILSFGASLKAGYSIENAFLEACRDLTYLYDASAVLAIMAFRSPPLFLAVANTFAKSMISVIRLRSPRSFKSTSREMWFSICRFML